MDRRTLVFLIAGLLVTLVVAGVVSTVASSEPDGLERVAIDEGFADTAADHALDGAPLADYSVGSTDDGLGTGIAGVIGVVITLVAMTGLLYGARAVHRRKTTTAGT